MESGKVLVSSPVISVSPTCRCVLFRIPRAREKNTKQDTRQTSIEACVRIHLQKKTYNTWVAYQAPEALKLLDFLYFPGMPKMLQHLVINYFLCIICQVFTYKENFTISV